MSIEKEIQIILEAVKKSQISVDEGQLRIKQLLLEQQRPGIEPDLMKDIRC